MSKRLFDLLLSSIGLLLLAPVLLAIALVVKLDSPGPVFFRQERVGRFGRPFFIHKFRTMRHEPAGQGLQITVGADARITRSGRFLRASKLDELAQLIDVWQGSMSLVGPRPEVPRYVAHYPEALRDKVLSVRPGITDIASIEYRDESRVLAQAANPEQAYIHEVLPHKLALAASYVDQASVWLDLKLILRTIGAIVRG
ncbi:sugar transferase [Aquabacterium sp.]|jgi:lipopolysaccharide/colanic/teichoic acid biosynthesis glycosyltransferase|uniref:sugar transferase n=1 Tax=Aquabacterium sp. TaxID=1872578 RepID=UPI0025BB7CE4|nr:sugar transferase [Aquabacterium sp.]